MPKTFFQDAWQRVSQIDGWLSEREADLLYEAALTTPDSGTIVEIGAYRGRSTSLLADSGRRVVTVDPLAPGFGHGNGMAVVDQDAEQLHRVIAECPNVTWIRERSTNAPQPPVIDLLYIDGDHTGTAPMDDYRHFAANVPPGGLVAFHDFLGYESVTEAVLELESRGELETWAVRGTMYVGRKLGP
jgi:predicted O-methyltransferase YrrM